MIKKIVSVTILILITFVIYYEKNIKITYVDNVITSQKYKIHLNKYLEHKINFLDHDNIINISVWNIYKQQKPNWKMELDRLMAKSELILLQEAKLTNNFNEYLQSKNLSITMARAFEFNKKIAGVMTLSKKNASKEDVFLSREPWIHLPKSALISCFPLSNGTTIVVINIHAINFTLGTHLFEQQLNNIFSVVKSHQGPMIFAGDFNTWSTIRQKVVNKFLHELKLKSLDLNIDRRKKVFGQYLDHIYYRDLEPIQSTSEKSNASDHNPIYAKFKLLK
ncbi:hypothetical protein CF386_01275 [Paraphotobacterium marinum]|uniref:Endonuclease/exonuclease/phosphatase domain-containing protein n=1 Tax=Paraphotobacterium marinum TaxID=1755811 RepID=A0A220VCV1_9GAMM|nr:endonuclease/exonuclease/phosphatase family protein [Paraphotobacterium marinum]ASK77803.1 hypothetical protein CF386_01275 [Paraphotobacterium marinum]